MAQLQNTSITGSLEFNTGGFFKLGTTLDTGSVGNMWYDTGSNEVKVSFCGLGPATWSAGGAMINTTLRGQLGVHLILEEDA